MWHAVPTVKEPAPRTQHTATVVGHFMYVIGGVSGVEPATPFMTRLNFLNLTWETVKCVGPSPQQRYQHTATLVKRQIFIIGGHGSENTSIPIAFDVDAFKWNEYPVKGSPLYPMLPEMTYHTAGKKQKNTTAPHHRLTNFPLFSGV